MKRYNFPAIPLMSGSIFWPILESEAPPLRAAVMKA